MIGLARISQRQLETHGCRAGEKVKIGIKVSQRVRTGRSQMALKAYQGAQRPWFLDMSGDNVRKEYMAAFVFDGEARAHNVDGREADDGGGLKGKRVADPNFEACYSR